MEARGVTGALGNLLDFASLVARRSPRIDVELATYWRAPRRGAENTSSAGIQACIDAATAAGIHSHVLHERFAGDPQLLPQVRALLHRTAADVIETHHVKSHFLAAACGGGDFYRWIAFHHGYTTTSVKTRAYNLLDLWSLRRPAAIVTPCQAFADQLRRHGVDGARINVIHSAVSARLVDEKAGSDIRAQFDLRATDRIILAAGRLSREKAHDVLIAAFSRECLAQLPDVTLMIAGDGPERARLADLAVRLRVPRIRFVGHQTNIWPFYAAADVIALPSHSEGSPLALLEAMAAGKPVVATRVGGVPEIVEDGRTGLLIPPRDPDALAAALLRVLDNPLFGSELGAAARATVQHRFTHGIRANALSSLYRRVCAV